MKYKEIIVRFSPQERIKSHFWSLPVEDRISKINRDLEILEKHEIFSLQIISLKNYRERCLFEYTNKIDDGEIIHIQQENINASV